MTDTTQADAQSQVAAIREQHRKWMYYTERLTEALRDEGSASELYGYYLAMKDAHEPTTQRHIGALLRALDAAEARATRAEAVLSEVRDACLYMLSYPEAHHSPNYTSSEYQPYDDILNIVDPPPEDPRSQGEHDAYMAYLHAWKPGDPMQGFGEWRKERRAALADANAQPPDAIDARHAHEAGYDAPGYDEDEG